MVKGFEFKVGAMVPPMSTFLYPQMLWSEFVHVLGFSRRDLRSLGCTSLQGFTIQRREVNRRYGELGEGGPRFCRGESAGDGGHAEFREVVIERRTDPLLLSTQRELISCARWRALLALSWEVTVGRIVTCRRV